MKQLFIITILWLTVSFHSHAQRYLPGQQGIQFTYGIVDDINYNTQNICAGAAFSTYTKNRNRWVIGGEYLQKHYVYKEVFIPKIQYTAEGGYYLNFLTALRQTVFFSVGASALAGYETINNGYKHLYDGATLINEDGFIYGGALTFEIETYISNWLVLLVNARERILTGSDIGKFHTQLGVGVKFIIN